MNNPQITIKPRRTTIVVDQHETTIVRVGTQGPSGESGAIALAAHVADSNPHPQYLGAYQLIPVVNGVSAYSLSGIPVAPDRSQLYLNGGKQQLGIDYTINASVLNWTSTTMPINSLDLLEIYYR